MTLSIITINYNNKDGLKKTIESVVTQTETDFEYIIIDGASTDGSAELIQEYAEHPEYGKKIAHWVSEPDTGIYNAINKGIKKATGEYLHILNSGDWYEEGALSHILPKLKDEQPDVLLCVVNFWDEKYMLSSEIHYEKNLLKGTMSHPGTIYKKQFHSKHNLYDESYKIASDFDFCVKAFLNSNVQYLCLYIPVINFTRDGISCTNSLASIEFKDIQRKHGLIKSTQTEPAPLINTPTQKRSYLKKIIKCIIPYGIIRLWIILKHKKDVT